MRLFILFTGTRDLSELSDHDIATVCVIFGRLRDNGTKNVSSAFLLIKRFHVPLL